MTAAPFQPPGLPGLALPRIVSAPVRQCPALDGSATDWHMIHFGHLAPSGVSPLGQR